MKQAKNKKVGDKDICTYGNNTINQTSVQEEI